MQILTSGQYNVLDDLARNPNATVQVKRNYDSIPFAGKSIQSTLTNESTPKQVQHSNGSLCVVYSKYVTADAKNQIYFKKTDVAMDNWETAIKLTTGTSYDYSSPTLTQILSSNSIGIVFSRTSTDLYSMVIDEDGVIETVLTDTGLNGINPSLVKVGTTYWLFYERSGIIYYSTSTDFITWTAEANFVTITGLSNNHYLPFSTYDESGNLWVAFERVTDASASPVVINVYTIMSDDDGATWGSPVAQTTLIAGEGSAINPSIADMVGYRYLSYTLQRTIQNLVYGTGSDYEPRMYQLDTVNNRIGMIHGLAGAADLIIYNRLTGLYTTHDLSTHGLTGSVTSLAYDEVNQLWAIGTESVGIIIYDEINVTWNTYNTTSTPAIAGTQVNSDKMVFENKELYFIVSNNTSFTKYIQKLDLNTNTISTLKDITVVNASTPKRHEIYISNEYVVVLVRCRYSPGQTAPFVFVFNATDDTELYSSTLVQTGYVVSYPDQTYASAGIDSFLLYSSFGFDKVNNNIYCNASDSASPGDNGIIVFKVNVGSITFVKYYSQLVSNPSNLLPSRDNPSGKAQFIKRLNFNSDTNRLYIESFATGGTLPGTQYYSVFNVDTELVVETYAVAGDTNFASYFPAIDSAMIKIIPTSGFMTNYMGFISSADKEIIFGTYTGNPFNGYTWHILTTESSSQRIYYKRTNDDITWTTEAFLTSSLSDSVCSLAYVAGRLNAFWTRSVSGVLNLRWDEDLSTEVDISSYVRSFEINMTDETGANTASVTLSDKDGVFNPLNYNSLKYDYLLENNYIIISKGNAGGVTPAFKGYIASGDSKYTRGNETLYTVKVYDRSKNWFKSKITSPFYEGQTVSAIVENIITTYGNLTAVDYDLPTISATIPKVQFIEEYIMDVLYKLYQAYQYFPYFDEAGILRARKVDYEASTDFTYYEEGTDTVDYNKAPAFNLVEFNHTWSDDSFVNKVTVIGQTEETVETIFDEEFLGFLQGSAGWFSTVNSFTFYFSEDKTLYAVNPRLSVTDSCGNKFFGGGESLSAAGSGKQLSCTVSQNVTNLTATLFALIAGSIVWTILWGEGFGVMAVYNGLAPVLAIALAVLGQISSFYYEIYAQPVGEAAPESIEVTVEDAELIEKYGEEIVKEIDNPFLETEAKCSDLAYFELNKASWFRYQPQLKILSNMAHQVQDILYVYNPVTKISYKMYIKEIRRTYVRGEEDVDQLTCGLIT